MDDIEHRRRRVDRQRGLAVALDEPCAQGVVRRDERVEGAAPRARVERAMEPCRERHVVRGVRWIELVKKPQPPLRTRGAQLVARRCDFAACGRELRKRAREARELREDGMLEEVRDLERDLKRSPEPRGHGERLERRPAEREEVIVGMHARDRDDLFPRRRDQRFGGVERTAVRILTPRLGRSAKGTHHGARATELAGGRQQTLRGAQQCALRRAVRRRRRHRRRGNRGACPYRARNGPCDGLLDRGGRQDDEARRCVRSHRAVRGSNEEPHGRLVTWGAVIGKAHGLCAALDGERTDPPEDVTFDAAAERATAQKKDRNVERAGLPLPRFEAREADEPVVAEAIACAHDPRVGLRRDLCRRHSARRRVELVGAECELRGALHIRRCRALHVDNEPELGEEGRHRRRAACGFTRPLVAVERRAVAVLDRNRTRIEIPNGVERAFDVVGVWRKLDDENVGARRAHRSALDRIVIHEHERIEREAELASEALHALGLRVPADTHRDEMLAAQRHFGSRFEDSFDVAKRVLARDRQEHAGLLLP